MAGKPLYRYVLICDGCDVTLGENGEYENAVTARAAAAELGWALIPKLKANGEPGKAVRADGNMANAHDACPGCRSTFQPEQMTSRGGTYWKDLREENRRLRGELGKRGIQA